MCLAVKVYGGSWERGFGVRDSLFEYKACCSFPGWSTSWLAKQARGRYPSCTSDHEDFSAGSVRFGEHGFWSFVDFFCSIFLAISKKRDDRLKSYPSASSTS